LRSGSRTWEGGRSSAEPARSTEKN
jgi:hypothetical protein